MMARKDKLKVSRRQLQEEVAKLETEVKSLNHNMNELQRVIGEIENMSSLIENEVSRMYTFTIPTNYRVSVYRDSLSIVYFLTFANFYKLFFRRVNLHL